MWLALSPAHFSFEASILSPLLGQGAFAAAPFDDGAPDGWVRDEAVDEENEEETEESDSEQAAYHPLAEIRDCVSVRIDWNWNDTPHLPLTRDRRRSPRSPPQILAHAPSGTPPSPTIG
jgi:hypothetical protein